MVREHIRKCFESVSCYLMPSPGSKVQSGDTDGRISGECLTEFIIMSKMAAILS
jgi:hypothetical protein